MSNQSRRKTDSNPEFQAKLVQIDLDYEKEVQTRSIQIHQMMKEQMKEQMDARLEYIRRKQQAKCNWELSEQSERRRWKSYL